MKTDTLSKKEYIVVPPHASPTGRYHVQTYSTLAGVLYGTHHTIVLLPLFVRLHGGKEITRNCIAVCYVLSLSLSLSISLPWPPDPLLLLLDRPIAWSKIYINRLKVMFSLTYSHIHHHTDSRVARTITLFKSLSKRLHSRSRTSTSEITCRTNLTNAKTI